MNYERSSQKCALQTDVWMAQSVGLHKVQIKHPQSEHQVLGQERCIFIYLLFWGKFKTSFSIHLENTEELLEMLDTLVRETAGMVWFFWCESLGILVINVIKEISFFLSS